LRRLLLAVAEQLESWGFRTLVVLNAHGGNTSVLSYTLQEIAQRFGFRVHLLPAPAPKGLSAQEGAYGFHAGEYETSCLLALAPESVRMERAVVEYPARIDDPGELRPENAPATFAWATRDVSVSGVMGDARTATAEKGRRWLEQGAEAYAEAIAAFYAATSPGD
jgi:creatinine amidohydrolase